MRCYSKPVLKISLLLTPIFFHMAYAGHYAANGKHAQQSSSDTKGNTPASTKQEVANHIGIDYHAHGKHIYAKQAEKVLSKKSSGQNVEVATEKNANDHAIVGYHWRTSSTAPMPHAQPTLQETKARAIQPWLNQIHVPYANQLHFMNNMRNVIIGVADTVLETSHPQLIGKVVQSYNGFDGSNNVLANASSTKYKSHATSVSSAALGRLSLLSGTEGQKNLQGTAIDAKLSMAKVFNDQSGGSWSWTAFTNSINWMAHQTPKPDIINLSLGGNSPFTSDAVAALKNAIKKNILLTIASGNEGQSQPSWPAAYANAAWANGQIIVVGSVDSNNQLSSFSNAAGVTAPWYVVAPGEEVLLGGIGKTYATLDGTSFAAPIVAGQAALIKSQWPQLTSNEIAQIIFQTTTRLGAMQEDGVPDSLYGWGLINIEKSLQPIGVLEVQLADGTKLPVALLSMGTLEGAVGAAIRAAVTREKFIIGGATDIYSRQFSVDLRDAIDPVPASSSLAHMFDNSDRQMRSKEVVLDKQNSRLRYTLSEPNTLTSKGILVAQQQNRTSLNSLGLVKRFANGNEFSAAIGGENIYMGLADYHIDDAPELTSTSLNDAYHRLVPVASSFGVGKSFSNGVKIKFGLSGSHLAQTLSNQTAPNYILQTQTTMSPAKVNLSNIEISKNFGRTIMGLGFGNINEQSALLGTQLGTGFNLNNTSSTRVLTMNMAHKIAQDVALAGYFSYGTTAGYDNSGSLISNISTTASQAYGISLVMRNALNNSDRLTLGISSPLATTSGVITLDLPDTVNAEGKIIRAKREISLASPARELRTEISYLTPMSKISALHLTLGHRQHVNNIEDEKETLAVLGYRMQF